MLTVGNISAISLGLDFNRLARSIEVDSASLIVFLSYLQQATGQPSATNDDVINIMLIVSLQMSQHGMKFLRFHNVYDSTSGQMEKVVQFDGNNIDLGQVVTNGNVAGYKDKDLHIQGSRKTGHGEKSATLDTLGFDLWCRQQYSSNYTRKWLQIISSHSLRPLFSAQHPVIAIDKKIKKLSTARIVTNKIRSPIDENLKMEVENLSIRGNEGIHMEANAVKFSGMTSVIFNTSRDGSIQLGGRLRFDTSSRGLPLSPSPALSASIDAYRLCVCAGVQNNEIAYDGFVIVNALSENHPTNGLFKEIHVNGEMPVALIVKE
ncbi:hypothetical protein NECAME_08831 [Necator americanus]|uniref:Beta-sarcoglycan n=1 Tax=Necator americanus TaxID=51031 RepID=W2TIY3_NECAM|nr:hypothetical protein NECAME_08831 [Necator americanus]ETN80982.1 hypothetical protein NECAME_08831 [Necator americanus]